MPNIFSVNYKIVLLSKAVLLSSVINFIKLKIYLFLFEVLITKYQVLGKILIDF